MDRRSFLQNSSWVAAGTLLLAGKIPTKHDYHLAMVRGGSPAPMLDLAIEVFGDIKTFIQPGQKILMKPTILWNQLPESGANTNPKLLAHLTDLCYDAGAREVLFVEHTVDAWTKCYKNSGIERAVKDVGAKILPGNKEFLYHEVAIPNAQVMKTAKIHEGVLDTDVIINVPAVSQTEELGYFGAFDNLMELVWPTQLTKSQRPQCMVDFLRFRKPVLNIIDASRVLQRIPTKQKSTGRTQNYKTLILSSDIISSDVFAAKRLGVNPESLPYLTLAAQAGFGQMNPPADEIRSLVLKNSQ
ncbi:MAG TPA: DUF362 domain-containing protein [Sunxiuqinia sp.]|nr:DUF362 domain-containing protein [Sunxiuqinia sp.]